MTVDQARRARQLVAELDLRKAKVKSHQRQIRAVERQLQKLLFPLPACNLPTSLAGEAGERNRSINRQINRQFLDKAIRRVRRQANTQEAK